MPRAATELPVYPIAGGAQAIRPMEPLKAVKTEPTSRRLAEITARLDVLLGSRLRYLSEE